MCIISAVKAMQIAAEQGQTIHTINQHSYTEISPKLQGSTLTDINNAMWAGRVVTVHEKTLSYKGWTGDGFSIVDPNTGGGAYLINGGVHGGIAYFYGAIIGSALALAVISFDMPIGRTSLYLYTAMVGFLAGFIVGTLIVAAVQR